MSKQLKYNRVKTENRYIIKRKNKAVNVIINQLNLIIMIKNLNKLLQRIVINLNNMKI
jgi:hypothetical protein